MSSIVPVRSTVISHSSNNVCKNIDIAISPRSTCRRIQHSCRPRAACNNYWMVNFVNLCAGFPVLSSTSMGPLRKVPWSCKCNAPLCLSTNANKTSTERSACRNLIRQYHHRFPISLVSVCGSLQSLPLRSATEQHCRFVCNQNIVRVLFSRRRTLF